MGRVIPPRCGPCYGVIPPRGGLRYGVIPPRYDEGKTASSLLEQFVLDLVADMSSRRGENNFSHRLNLFNCVFS